jgi:glycosyltransferase involved in cell wall biosynthesis
MKIIALLPFKNEEWVLQEYIHSVKKITDTIIAYDDMSTDRGRDLLEKAGAILITENYKEKSGWAEHSIRERLLREGRSLGGTHFICLDADEIFSNNFYHLGKEFITSLQPGQSLWLDWVNVYRDTEHERIDTVYKKISKSFIFCDDRNSQFPYAFLGVSRTPGDPLNRIVIPREQGSVIHFQFLNTKRSTMKRNWYMCSELIKATRSPRRINTTYFIQKDREDIPVKILTDVSAFEIVNRSITQYDPSGDWRFKEILTWFDDHTIEFFEPLDIWEDEIFRDLFIKRKKREPKPVLTPVWLMKINDLKNSIRNAILAL